MIFDRQIARRAQKIAPFLTFDDDPYLVVHDGRLFWILDAYTVTDRYPYASEAAARVSYIRNAAKVVIDAYHGTTTFYLAEPDDPIVRAYAKAFPTLFTPLDQMPAGLRRHVRYPEGIFGMQAAVYSTYHMTSPAVFYNKEDQWEVPTIDSGGQAVRMSPYYTIMKLPGEQRAEFIQMLPFTPRRRDNLASWLVARSDGDKYGQLMAFEFPKQKLVFGPRQVVARINQDQVIAPQITLWNQQGSEVIQGTLMVIPIEESLLYVRPMYLRAQAGRIPELTRVIVAYQNSIVMERTLDAALGAAVLARGGGGAEGAAEGHGVRARRTGRARRGAPAARLRPAPVPAAPPRRRSARRRRCRRRSRPCRRPSSPPRPRPPISGPSPRSAPATGRRTAPRSRDSGRSSNGWRSRGSRRRSYVRALARAELKFCPTSQTILQNTARAADDDFPASANRSVDAGASGQQVGDVRADRRAVLEAVARAAADDPHVGPGRMRIDQEVAGRGVLVLADAGVEQRRRRPAPGSGGPGSPAPARPPVLVDRPLGGVGIDGRAVPVDAHLEAVRVEIGDAVDAGREVDPHRQVLDPEPRVAGRHAEVEKLLPRGANPRADGQRQQPRQPRAARPARSDRPRAARLTPACSSGAVRVSSSGATRACRYSTPPARASATVAATAWRARIAPARGS